MKVVRPLGAASAHGRPARNAAAKVKKATMVNYNLKVQRLGQYASLERQSYNLGENSLAKRARERPTALWVKAS